MRGDEDAACHELVVKGTHALGCIENERHDGGGGLLDGHAKRCKAATDAADVALQRPDKTRLAIDDAERFPSSVREDRRDRGRALVDPCFEPDEIDQCTAACDRPAVAAKALGERACPDNPWIAEAKVLAGAAPAIAKDAKAVAIVDNYRRMGIWKRCKKLGDRRDRAIGGEKCRRSRGRLFGHRPRGGG
jgi:hypothetical protein